MKIVVVASHLVIGHAVRVAMSAQQSDAIADITSAAEGCPCVNATRFLNLYIKQQDLAVTQCISLYSTSGSNVTGVSSGDAGGVATV